MLMDLIKNLDVPDIQFDGGSLSQNSFFIKESVNDVKISPDVDLNGIRIELRNLEAGFSSGHFHYDKGIIKTDGNMDIDLHNVYLAITIQLDEQPFTIKDRTRQLPAFSVQHVAIAIPIDANHFKIHFHGDFAAEVIGVLAPLFSGLIRDQISNALNDALIN